MSTVKKQRSLDCINLESLRNICQRYVPQKLNHLNSQEDVPQLTDCTEQTVVFLLTELKVDSTLWQALVRPLLLQQEHLLQYILNNLDLTVEKVKAYHDSILKFNESGSSFPCPDLFQRLAQQLTLCLGLGETTELINCLLNGLKRILKIENNASSSQVVECTNGIAALGAVLERWSPTRLPVFERLMLRLTDSNQPVREATLKAVYTFLRDDDTFIALHQRLQSIVPVSQQSEPVTTASLFATYSRTYPMDSGPVHSSLLQKIESIEGPVVPNDYQLKKHLKEFWKTVTARVPPSWHNEFKKSQPSTWGEVCTVFSTGSKWKLTEILSALAAAFGCFMSQPTLFSGELVRLNIFRALEQSPNVKPVNELHGLCEWILKEMWTLVFHDFNTVLPRRQSLLRLMTNINLFPGQAEGDWRTWKFFSPLRVEDWFIGEAALKFLPAEPPLLEKPLSWKEWKFLLWIIARPLDNLLDPKEKIHCCSGCTLLTLLKKEFVRRFQSSETRAHAYLVWLLGDPHAKVIDNKTEEDDDIELLEPLKKRAKIQERHGNDHEEEPMKSFERLSWTNVFSENEVSNVINGCRRDLIQLLRQNQQWLLCYERLLSLSLRENTSSDSVVEQVCFLLPDVGPLSFLDLHQLLCVGLKSVEQLKFDSSIVSPSVNHERYSEEYKVLPIVYDCRQRNGGASAAPCSVCTSVCRNSRRGRCERCGFWMCSKCSFKHDHCLYCENGQFPEGVLWFNFLKDKQTPAFNFLAVWDYQLDEDDGELLPFQLNEEIVFQVVIEADVMLAMAAWSFDVGRKEVFGDFYAESVSDDEIVVQRFIPLDNVNKGKDAFGSDTDQKFQARELMKKEGLICAGTFHSHPHNTELLPTVEDAGGHLYALPFGIIVHSGTPTMFENVNSFEETMKILCSRVLVVHIPQQHDGLHSICPRQLPCTVRWNNPSESIEKAKGTFTLYEEQIDLPKKVTKKSREDRLTVARHFINSIKL